MKKAAIVLALLLGISMFVGCQAKEEQVKEQSKETVVTVGGLKGPTSMGMVKLMEDAKDGVSANNYAFTIASSPDELTPKLLKGELDMAAIPANLASVLYNNSKGDIQVLAINTLGVVYIVENQEMIHKVEDLRGKTIYATGKGTSPEYALSHILKLHGLNPGTDVMVEWKSEPTEVVALLKEKPGSIGMLPQPFVTVAQSSVEGLEIALDLTKEWEAVDDKSACITGVLVANKTFVENNEEEVRAFLKEYEASATFTADHPKKAAKLIESYDIVKATIAEEALPYCNITFIEGREMKEKLKGYLTVLYDQMPQAVGGALPEDEFYYE